VKRQEFTEKTMVAAWTRADGRCQWPGCGIKLFPGDARYDHIAPCDLHPDGGDNSLANCQVLCRDHHYMKTVIKDWPLIKKGRRIRKRHIGAKRSRTPIRGWKKFDGTPVRNPRLR